MRYAAGILVLLVLAVPLTQANPLTDAPSELHATYELATGDVALTWTAPHGEVLSYNVYRNGDLIGSTDVAGFLDDVAPGGAMTYSITASTIDGESAPSLPAIVATAGPGDSPLELGSVPFADQFEESRGPVVKVGLVDHIGIGPPGLWWECSAVGASLDLELPILHPIVNPDCIEAIAEGPPI